MDDNWVSYEEQKQSGLIRQQRSFIPPAPKQEILPPMAEPMQSADYSLNLPQSATQHVEVKSSAVDRAKGFAIETRELGIVYGAAMVLVAWLFADIPLFSGWTLTLFVITYSITWGFAYFQHKQHSAEGVSLYEAKGKVEIVKRVVDAQVRQFEKDRELARRERIEDRKRRLQ